MCEFAACGQIKQNNFRICYLWTGPPNKFADLGCRMNPRIFGFEICEKKKVCMPTVDHRLARQLTMQESPSNPGLHKQPLLILTLHLIAKEIAALSNLPATLQPHQTPPILGLLNANCFLCDYLYDEKPYII